MTAFPHGKITLELCWCWLTWCGLPPGRRVDRLQRTRLARCEGGFPTVYRYEKSPLDSWATFRYADHKILDREIQLYKFWTPFTNHLFKYFQGQGALCSCGFPILFLMASVTDFPPIAFDFWTLHKQSNFHVWVLQIFWKYLLCSPYARFPLREISFFKWQLQVPTSTII